jgi:hypothetical protein
VLENDTAITVADLLDITDSGRWKAAPPPGQYL